MKAAKLKALVQAMHDPPRMSEIHILLDIAEHAPSLVALLEACEARDELRCDPACNGWHHTEACQRRVVDADRAVGVATVAVHAVGGAASE